MSDVKKPIYPFSNGTQFDCWNARNCERCTKYDGQTNGLCEISDALTVAYIDDGTVTPEMSKRMGHEAHRGDYTWDCPERINQ